MRKKQPFFDFILDIENEKEQLDFKVDAELRRLGWKHCSSNPSALWLWLKEIDGVKYTLPRQHAISMETVISSRGWP